MNVIPVAFEKFKGTLDIDTNEVFFFNRRFDNIFEAMSFFKMIQSRTNVLIKKCSV